MTVNKMFTLNKISGACLLTAIVTLLIGLVFSSVRTAHTLTLFPIHSIIADPPHYRAIIHTSSWVSLITTSCHSPPVRVAEEWYNFSCTNKTITTQLSEIEASYTDWMCNGEVILIVYVSVFLVFVLLSFITGHLHARWYRGGYQTL